MIAKHQKLNQLYIVNVMSHVQREKDEWVLNTIMLEEYDVPFQYSRRKVYKNLAGARVNLTYYPETKSNAGVD